MPLVLHTPKNRDCHEGDSLANAHLKKEIQVFFSPARACTCIDLSTTRFGQNLGAAELNFTSLGIIQNI